MVKKIYEQDIIDGINSIGMVSVAYLDDLLSFYNEKRVFMEKLHVDDFMTLLIVMEKKGILILSRGSDVQLGHKGFKHGGNYYNAAVLILDKCEKS
jgi:hypothetical protein